MGGTVNRLWEKQRNNGEKISNCGWLCPVLGWSVRSFLLCKDRGLDTLVICGAWHKGLGVVIVFCITESALSGLKSHSIVFHTIDYTGMWRISQ